MCYFFMANDIRVIDFFIACLNVFTRKSHLRRSRNHDDDFLCARYNRETRGSHVMKRV